MTGYIDEHGKYIPGKSSKKLGNERNGMFRGWSHDQQRKAFAREIIQPHVDGKPSAEFIRAYPQYSKQYWKQEEIDKALREDMTHGR